MTARVWIGVFLLALWLIFFVWAAVTFPFIGNTTQGQNLSYALIVNMPFLVIMLIYMILAVKDMKAARGMKRCQNAKESESM